MVQANRKRTWVQHGRPILHRGRYELLLSDKLSSWAVLLYSISISPISFDQRLSGMIASIVTGSEACGTPGAHRFIPSSWPEGHQAWPAPPGTPVLPCPCLSAERSQLTTPALSLLLNGWVCTGGLPLQIPPHLGLLDFQIHSE